jgi:hypothetical protein
MTASPTYGVPPYTYFWSPGSVTTSSYFITPPPSSTTVYTLTVTDACGNTATDNVTIINPCLTLPVDIVTFTGYSEEGINYLHWVTSSEENTQYFEIERSTNEGVFEKIGSVPANTNTNDETIYAFTDNNAATGLNYYRLHMFDVDGSADYSQIIAIESGIQSNTLTIDAVASQSNLELNILAPKGGKATIILYDISGREILMQPVIAGTGKTTVILNIDGLESGSYVAVVSLNAETATEKFIKI